MSGRLKLPPERDFGFYQRRKHDNWRAVPAPEPALEAPVADSHAHVHSLPDPAWELTRCAANGVDFICEICDPSEDGTRPFDELAQWQEKSAEYLASAFENDGKMSKNGRRACSGRQNSEGASEGALPSPGDLEFEVNPESSETPELAVSNMRSGPFLTKTGNFVTQTVRIAAGVHPHNAKLYDDGVEALLLELLRDPRVGALGEVGLDYHYDLSPRDVQRRVFERQIEIAQELDLPIALHLRGGEDPQADNAHAEAFAILRDRDALGPRTLLHCCALPPDELTPWIEADCFIAYGGAVTFKSADAAREGARMVPVERLLLETDSPYMAPEPMRGAACTPAHVIFTAARLAEVRGIVPGDSRKAFLEQVHANTLSFYGRNE